MYIMFYLVNDKLKYIILCYPKSGCTVLRLLHIYLENYDNINIIKSPNFEDKHHSNSQYVNFNYKKEYDSYYKVIVYRDPYERICSTFYQKVCGIISNNVTQRNKLIKQPKRLTKNLCNFDQWLNIFIKESHSDIHFKPQKKNNFKYDEIIEISNINKLFEKNAFLNKLANEMLDKYNLNNRNSLIKYSLPEYRDLSNYDFHVDSNHLLKDNKVPDYKYLLNENTIKKIKNDYNDDFL